MFESAELGHKIDKATYKAAVPALRAHGKQDGEVAGAQTVPLVISKIGLGADIYMFAHRDAPIYGLIAVLMALVAGSSAAFLFRKV